MATRFGRREIRQIVQMTFLAILLVGCSSLPTKLPPRPYVAALPPAEHGTLQVIAKKLETRIGAEKSGFALLDRAEDALRMRLALIDEAERSLDVMSYLWWADDSGDLIARHLLQAAERGVRVRVIVDDLLLFGNDETTLAFESHPNVSIVLFNATRSRSLPGRALEALFNFSLTNVRMHTKLLVADNRFAILGGRNIGNEYFGIKDRFNFHDLDVLAVGPAAVRASGFFDHYWNSDWMAPAGLLGPKGSAQDQRALTDELDRTVEQSQRLARIAPPPTDWSDELERWTRDMAPGRSAVLYDILKPGSIERDVAEPLGRMLDLARSEILIANAYIIPNQEDIDYLREKCRRGIKIYILTNSLESHDVPAVHSHYRGWRKALLNTGCVRLHEFRADADLHGVADIPPFRSRYFGLHSKAAVVDRRYVFIGSLNFDPRSYGINVETGNLISSEELGARLAALIERDLSETRSWEVRIDPDGELAWRSTRGTVRLEPARGIWQRIEATLFGILPEQYF